MKNLFILPGFIIDQRAARELSGMERHALFGTANKILLVRYVCSRTALIREKDGVLLTACLE